MTKTRVKKFVLKFVAVRVAEPICEEMEPVAGAALYMTSIDSQMR